MPTMYQVPPSVPSHSTAVAYCPACVTQSIAIPRTVSGKGGTVYEITFTDLDVNTAHYTAKFCKLVSTSFSQVHLNCMTLNDAPFAPALHPHCWLGHQQHCDYLILSSADVHFRNSLPHPARVGPRHSNDTFWRRSCLFHAILPFSSTSPPRRHRGEHSRWCRSWHALHLQPIAGTEAAQTLPSR